MNATRTAMLFVSLLAASAAAENVALDGMAKDPHLWSLPIEQFMQRYRDAEFRWVAVHETARSAATNTTFAGLRAWETIVHCSSGRPARIVYSLYNRGDAGSLIEPAYDRLVAEIQSNLTALAGARGETPRDIQGPANMKIMRSSWALAGTRMHLEWSFTPARRVSGISQPFRSEYVRVVLAPGRGASAAATEALAPVRMNVLDLRAKVTRNENGDVSITGIPMVDQGDKGYCAAAVTERVLRYFGQDIDQHKVAQIANTTTEMGTSPENLVKALRRISSSLDLNMRAYETFEFDDFDKLLKDYNRVAIKEDHPQIQIGHFLIVTDVYDMMEPEILKNARMKKSGEMQRFMETIRENVDAGVPLLWSVIVGKFEENPRLPIKHASGHLRLIHGYHPKQRYVIYSDTWGAGHERKYMPLEEAWAITTGLYTMKPVGVR